jgi:hypothetical protein
MGWQGLSGDANQFGAIFGCLDRADRIANVGGLLELEFFRKVFLFSFQNFATLRLPNP